MCNLHDQQFMKEISSNLVFLNISMTHALLEINGPEKGI